MGGQPIENPSHGMLAPKLVAAKLTIAKALPEGTLGVG